MKFTLGVTVGSALFLLSIIFLFYFSIRAVRKKIHSQFEQAKIDNNYCLEIFCIYLIGMITFPFVFRFLFPTLTAQNPLLISAFAILSTSLIALWPMLWGEKFNSTIHTLGISIGSAKKLFQDFIIGPTFYLAAWIPIICILIVYSIALHMLKINPESASHPIVPIMLSGDARISFLLNCFFLPVIVAPFCLKKLCFVALYTAGFGQDLERQVL